MIDAADGAAGCILLLRSPIEILPYRYRYHQIDAWPAIITITLITLGLQRTSGHKAGHHLTML